MNRTMKIDIKKKEKYYQDALIWMGYRFAIGLSESNSNGKRAIEQLKVFRDIEFDTPEFHLTSSMRHPASFKLQI